MQKEPNFPIKMKTKSTYARKYKPMLYVNQAYSKFVYESAASVVYEENPYVAVVQYRENVYGLLQPQTLGSGDAWMWLVVGPEKCMLIDNGDGLGDLKALIDRITGGKEIIPVVTHHHLDHAFGSTRFGKVYCHEDQVEKIRLDQDEHCYDMVVDENGKGIWVDFDRSDLPQWKPFDIIGVPDGYKFNLGGDYEIELIEVNGHDGDGDAVYLDPQSRILFSGDNIASGASVCGTVSYPIEECSVYKFKLGLEKILARMDDFDFLFSAHYIPDIEKYIFYDVKQAIDEVLEDPKKCDYVQIQPAPGGHGQVTRYFKEIIGFGGLSYYMDEK